MKYLNIGDAYIGRDGIVSVYPRGSGLDACCIPARDLLDSSHAKQREVKAYIEESLTRAGRMGVRDSKRTLQENIEIATDPKRLIALEHLARGHGIPTRHGIGDAARHVRQGEIRFHLGTVDEVNEAPVDADKLLAAIGNHSAGNADDLFSRAVKKVRGFSKTIYGDETGIKLMQANEAMQRAHQQEYKKMPEWVRKAADESGVALFCHNSFGPYTPVAARRAEAQVLNLPLVAAYLANTTITMFQPQSLNQGLERMSVAEETWHMMQNRFYPNGAADSALQDMSKAVETDIHTGKIDATKARRPLTQGEELLEGMARDADRQPEARAEELFANMMQAYTNPDLGSRRNNLCQYAPNTTRQVFSIMRFMEGEAAKPVASKNHQTDIGLSAIPVFSQGRARAPIQL